MPGPDPLAHPDAAVHALIRNEICIVRRHEGGERVVRFATGRRHGLGWPLARYLRAIGPRWPDELVARWCDDGRCIVDGAVVGPQWQVLPGRQVELRIGVPPPAAGTAPPLCLLWHDRHLAVACKPTGQLAHQAGREMSGTLLNQLQEWAAGCGIDPNEVRLVNRIDRETSGAVIASLSLAAHQGLAAQLAARTIAKTYRAICRGMPAAESGEWTDPIGALGAHTIRRGVLADGQPSRTLWRVEASAPGAAWSLLTLGLVTGRQHQIRVHASHHGHPLLGDWVYGEPVAELPGQALHAWRIAFEHPIAGGRIELEAPFPDALAGLWRQLLAGGAPTPVPLTAEQRSRLGLAG